MQAVWAVPRLSVGLSVGGRRSVRWARCEDVPHTPPSYTRTTPLFRVTQGGPTMTPLCPHPPRPSHTPSPSDTHCWALLVGQSMCKGPGTPANGLAEGGLGEGHHTIPPSQSRPRASAGAFGVRWPEQRCPPAFTRALRIGSLHNVITLQRQPLAHGRVHRAHGPRFTVQQQLPLPRGYHD